MNAVTIEPGKGIAIEVTLEQLRPGHEYPGSSVNARTAYRDSEIESLAASLLADGQLKPVLVCTHQKKPGVYFVFDGGRRRSAFGLLLSRKQISKDHKVEAKNYGDIPPRLALAKSLAANEQIPLHPADRAAVFATINEGGAEPEEIAKRYGMTILAVNQSLALGTALAPEVLEAWRAGDLDKEAVQLFTLCEREKQADELSRIKESWPYKSRKEVDLRELRRRFMHNNEAEQTRLLGFVGREAYEAAGGKVTRDFFGAGGVVGDMRLLKKLAKKKLDDEIARQTADGWAWAEGKLKKSHMGLHGYGQSKVKPSYEPDEVKRRKQIDEEIDKLDEQMNGDDGPDMTGRIESLEGEKKRIEQAAALRSYSGAQKKKAGIIVQIADDGSVEYAHGLIRREEPKAKNGSAAPKQEREEEALNYNVRHKLEEWINDAAGALLAEQPLTAVAAWLASCETDDWKAPISADAGHRRRGLTKQKTFEGAFAEFRKASEAELFAFVAKIAGGCVSIARGDGKIMKTKDAELLLSVIDKRRFQDELKKRFDAKVYFGGASQRHMLGALKEMLGEVARKEAEAKNIAQIREKAIFNADRTGWLPPELRTELYERASAEKPKGKKRKAA